ncbi:MAG: EamA family transporter, partial [Christensenellaceae bacterium]|nr:EamA family transporter [Christensenellaceae bacterium]
MKQDRTKATLLILLQCAVYGASFIALKVLVDTGVPIFAIICIRFSIGFLTLVALKPLYNKNSSESSPSHKSLKYGLIAGIALFFAYMWQTLASQTTTPAKNGLFTDLFIIFTPIATMMLTRRFSIKPVFSGLMAF